MNTGGTASPEDNGHEKLNTEIVQADLRELKQLGTDADHENARFMKPDQFRRLVDNIARDGCLTSTPLVAQISGEKGDTWYVCSGNHRVQAAIEAGVTEAAVLRIVEPVTKQRFIAIQLAHNAVEGEDDPTTLKRLYDSLDLEFKEYSGLTDDAFDINDLDVTTLSNVAPMYVEIVLSFLGPDAESVEAFLKRAEKWAAKNRPVLVTDHAEFNKFFETVVAVKNLRNVTNSAVALSAMIELARERLEQLEESEDRSQ